VPPLGLRRWEEARRERFRAVSPRVLVVAAEAEPGVVRRRVFACFAGVRVPSWQQCRFCFCVLPPGWCLLAGGWWLLAAGCWLLPARCSLLAASCYWLLAAGCWLLAADCWLLAADCWLLAGGWSAGCWPFWLLPAGRWLLPAGRRGPPYWTPGGRPLGFRYYKFCCCVFSLNLRGHTLIVTPPRYTAI